MARPVASGGALGSAMVDGSNSHAITNAPLLPHECANLAEAVLARAAA
ncbi:hypothetical protein [Actinoplanes sp. TFC3]|nr:hypothetical protein [Actinoplanes sp. TFC3]